MAAGAQTDSPLFLLDYALRLLRVVVLLALWRTIFAQQGPKVRCRWRRCSPTP